MRFDVPGHGVLELDHLVLDYNGTLALDGRLKDGVADTLNRLAAHLSVHIITADTHGSVRREMDGVRCAVVVIGGEDQNREKRDFVRSLGSAAVAALGNGRNDELMLGEAALGICLIQEEGAYARTLMAADVVCRSILDGLALLENPGRLIATLRNR